MGFLFLPLLSLPCGWVKHHTLILFTVFPPLCLWLCPTSFHGLLRTTGIFSLLFFIPYCCFLLGSMLLLSSFSPDWYTFSYGPSTTGFFWGKVFALSVLPFYSGCLLLVASCLSLFPYLSWALLRTSAISSSITLLSFLSLVSLAVS